jgi:hypothetical protein
MKSLYLPVLLCGILTVPVRAQMVTGDRMTHYDTVFGLARNQKAKDLTVTQLNSELGSNVLHKGEKISLTLRLENSLKTPLQENATIEVIGYGTSVPSGDIWVPTVFRTAGLNTQTIPVKLDVPANGAQNLNVTPPIPEHYGSYALILNVPSRGRLFAATVARTLTPDMEPVAFPAYSLDMPRTITPSSMAMFKKIGAKSSRMELGAFDTAAPDADKKWSQLDEQFGWMRENNVTVMLTVSTGSLPQPFGKPRPHLNADGIQMNTKADITALPEHDPKFQEWMRQIALRYGYPKGPVNAVELWNEPWEGISISGWGADMPRYREIYRAMANGILAARKEAGVKILIGGASSSSNTLDKLFPDGSDEFLPILDFASIHYQMMSAAPALIKQFLNRKPTPVQTWDTESWVANSEDRVPVVIASMRAMGQQRTKGIYGGNVYETRNVKIDGKSYDSTQAWSIAPAIAAVTKFIGNRNFDGLLFQNGLPWVFSFQGAPKDAEPSAKNVDNGTLVVVGDLSGVYDPNLMLYRGVLGLKNIPKVAEVDKKIAALPADTPTADRKKLEAERLRARLLTGGTLTFDNVGGRFRLFDFSGNPIPTSGSKITIPLDTLGYYVRTDGSRGSFATLKKAVASARIEGYEPLDIVARDFTAPISNKPVLRLEITNILNRPVSGTLDVKVEGLTFVQPRLTVKLKANERKTISLKVAEGTEVASNNYPLEVVYDAGADGQAVHSETIRANVISKRTIQIDGNLEDWSGVLPQKAGGQGIGANLTEKAWLPFFKYEEGTAGIANSYMAYDDKNFYFAAKIADSTPDLGTLRFSEREDEQFYYPPVAYSLNTTNSLQKKDNVFAAQSTESRALQLPKSNERAIAFYETTTTTSFASDVEIPDGVTRQVALYMSDVDHMSRRIMKVDMIDETGKVIDTREIKNFSDGSYLVYAVKGKVRFKITSQNWTTALLNAVFIDPTTETSSKFLRVDNETVGNWKGKYGSIGYHLTALNQQNLPEGMAVNFPEVLDKTPLSWPEGVRRYSYRMRPILPFNTGDDVQIAFNVIPDDKEDWLPNPPGVPPRWESYKDTDYEYSLHNVAPQYGGGNEVWRLLVPGMPRKHFYPRQPKWKGNGRWTEGAVQDAKLSMTRDGNTRLVELALPWSELPDVKAKLDAGAPVKFSFRIGDNGGQPYELTQERSVSKINFPSFHPDFATHWSNEVEFGWEK